jgi:SAM-dependent methyltransferase
MLEDFSPVAITGNNAAAAQEEEYFGGYGDTAVHKLMLSDEPRMAFYGGIMSQPELIKGKVVVEVGCGSGVISLWSLLYGEASRVVAIEGSPDMAEIAQAVAEENGATVIPVTDVQYRKFAQDAARLVRGDSSNDGTAVSSCLDQITGLKALQGDIVGADGGDERVLVIFKGRSTTLVNPFDYGDVDEDDCKDIPCTVSDDIKAMIAYQLFRRVFLCGRSGDDSIGGVDVLVSEWMGFYLVHESMLPSVIEMREFLSHVNSLHSNNYNDTNGAAGDDDLYQYAPVMVPDTANITGAPVSLIPLFNHTQSSFWSRIHFKPSPSSSATMKAPLAMNTIGLLQFNAQIATCIEKGQPLVDELPVTATVSTAGVVPTLLATPKCINPINLQYATQEDLLSCGGKVVFDDFGTYGSADVAIDGLALWFDVGLSAKAHALLAAGRCFDIPITERQERGWTTRTTSTCFTPTEPLRSLRTLDTSPQSAPTHWKQSVVLLPDEMRTDFRLEQHHQRKGDGRRTLREVEFNVPESALTVSALRGESVGVQFHIIREDYAEKDDDELGIPTATHDDDGSSCYSSKKAAASSRLYTVGFELFDPADE